MSILDKIHEQRFVLIHNSVPVIDIVAQYVSQQIAFHNHYQAILMAPSAAQAKKLLVAVKEQYNNDGISSKPLIDKSTAHSLELGNGSWVRTGIIGSNSERGISFNFMFVDDFSQIKLDVAQEFYESTSIMLATTKNSKIVIASGQTAFEKTWLNTDMFRIKYHSVDLPPFDSLVN